MLEILLFSALFIGIGVYLAKRVGTGTEFLVAGRQLSLTYLACSIAATHFGGGALIGGIQNGAQMGTWAAAYGILGYGVACFVNAWVAPKFRRVANNLTPPDFIESRYGASKLLRGYHVFVYIGGILAIIAAQFSAFGGVATAFGLERNTAVVVGALVIAVYTVLAGMWGVAVTDFIQLGICLAFLPVVAYLGSNVMTAETGITAGQVLSAPFFKGAAGVQNLLYMFIPTVVGSLFAYEYYLRYQSAKSEREARLSSVIAGFLLLAIAVPVAVIGGTAGVLFPGVEGSELLSRIVNTTLNPVARFAFMGAVMAAIMSTASALAGSLSGMVTRDIYHKILNPSSDFDELPNVLNLARITSLLACVIGMVIALRFTNIIELLFWTSPLQSGVIFAPMMFGLFWKRASSTGAYASIIVGACVALVDMLGIYAWPERMLFTMAASSLALVVGSLLKPDADNAEHLAHLQGK